MMDLYNRILVKSTATTTTAQQQQQQSQQYSQQQSSLFASDPSLQSRYAGLAGTGYRATPGVSSSLQPTLGDAIPQPVPSGQTTSPDNMGNGNDFGDSPGAETVLKSVVKNGINKDEIITKKSKDEEEKLSMMEFPN